MRYIPGLASDVIVQVPEDKNAYINVRNIGASGRGDLEFTGTVTDIDSEGIVTISGISDGEGGSIFQYSDLLKQGAELQVFGYRTPGIEDDPILSVNSHSETGNVDFSSSDGTNSNLGPLVYYVFGFNYEEGVVVNYTQRYEIGTKVLNPDLWSKEQHIKLQFNRDSTSILPVIFRSWSSGIRFLGVIGNNKIGYPGSGLSEFSDLGDTEISSWESDPEIPFYLDSVFLIGGDEVEVSKKLVAKETLQIILSPFGGQTSYIQCSGLSVTSDLQENDTLSFRIDDTGYIKTAVNTAESGAVKEVFFPSGIYNIRDTVFNNSSIKDYSNISLRGVGEGAIIRRLPASRSNPSYPGLLNFTGLTTSRRISGLRINSIALNGNRNESFSTVSPAESDVTLRVDNADNVVISNNTVFDNGGGGIAVYRNNDISVQGNRILRTGRSYETPASPLLIDTSENAVVQGNRLNFATTGPKVVSTEYSTINGNIIRGCGDKGINLETSFQWNAQGNLAYSDNDSIIRSIDTYNNEYSRATIEVRKGYSLDPVYMTVTYGGESVGIARDSVNADIYQLNVDGVKTGISVGSFRLLETSDQLEAGIFSLTLPGGTTDESVNTKTIIATGNLNNPYGYMYEVSGSVLLGGFRPLSIKNENLNGNNYFAIKLRNSSDILGFQIYSENSISNNDRIKISGYTNSNLSGWDPNASYPILNIDTATNSILIAQFPELSLTTEVEFSGGTLSILRPNYFIADGNLLVHSF